MTPFGTFTSISNFHNSASEVGMNGNIINNETNPIAIALLLNILHSFDFCC